VNFTSAKRGGDFAGRAVEAADTKKIQAQWLWAVILFIYGGFVHVRFLYSFLLDGHQ